MASDNKSLGRFILDGVPPAPRGMPQVEVTFDVDANGILNVKAMDKASGKSQSIRIEASSGLTDADIKKMQQDAELHAEEDAKKKEMADHKNTADMMYFTAEKSLKDYGDKITLETKKEVEDKMSALKTAKEGTDMEMIKSATSDLSTSLSKVGEEMAKAGTPPNPEANPSPEAQNEEIKDAEINESENK